MMVTALIWSLRDYWIKAEKEGVQMLDIAQAIAPAPAAEAGLWSGLNWGEMERVFHVDDEVQPVVLKDENGVEDVPDPCDETRSAAVMAAGLWSQFDWGEVGRVVDGDEQAITRLEGEAN
jgi:hypothetical protein